jgi:hypothetical protein
LNIKWVVKDFDDAIYISPSQKIPIDINLADLDKGERFVAKLIVFAFQDRMKFFQVGKDKCWYTMNEKNIWVKSSVADKYVIIKQLQDYIEEEKDRVWKLKLYFI